jgi:argininosuccinate synthase
MKTRKSKKSSSPIPSELDTSHHHPLAKEIYDDSEIIAISRDVGQGDVLEGHRGKGAEDGAQQAHVADLVDEMVDDIQSSRR